MGLEDFCSKVPGHERCECNITRWKTNWALAVTITAATGALIGEDFKRSGFEPMHMTPAFRQYMEEQQNPDVSF